MNSTEVLDKIDSMGELPVLPQTLLQIQRVATDDRASAEDLAQVILHDEALTMKVLKVVNSSFYTSKRKERVRTVSKAVMAMGFEQVRKLALGLSIFDMMSRLSRSPYLVKMAEHSMIVAAFAQRLAEASRRVPPEEAFVVGLIHDIGKVALIEVSPERYAQVTLEVEAGAEIEDAERRNFGLSHARAGRKLAAHWSLPHDLQVLIGEHHDIDPLHPPRSMEPSAAILMYADAMAHFRCDETHGERERGLLRVAAKALGIGTAAMEDLYVDAVAGLGDLAARLNLGLTELPDFAGLIDRSGLAHGASGPRPLVVPRRTDDLLRLHREVNKGMVEGADPEGLLAALVHAAHELLGLERVVLLWVDRAGRALSPWHAAGPGAEALAPRLALPLSEALGALAMTQALGRSFHVPFARSETYGEQAGSLLLELTQATSYATAPVTVGREVVGVFWADRGANGQQVSAEQAADLTELALQASLIWGRAPAPLAAPR